MDFSSHPMQQSSTASVVTPPKETKRMSVKSNTNAIPNVTSLVTVERKKRKKREHAEMSLHRPLNAYNLFFLLERKWIVSHDFTAHDDKEKNVLPQRPEVTIDELATLCRRHYLSKTLPKPKRRHRKTHGKITFQELSRCTAKKWKSMNALQKQIYESFALNEKKRYEAENKRIQLEKEKKSIIQKDSHQIPTTIISKSCGTYAPYYGNDKNNNEALDENRKGHNDNNNINNIYHSSIVSSGSSNTSKDNNNDDEEDNNKNVSNNDQKSLEELENECNVYDEQISNIMKRIQYRSTIIQQSMYYQKQQQQQIFKGLRYAKINANK